VHGDDHLTRKLRLCKADYDEVLSASCSEWVPASSYGELVATAVCSSCEAALKPGDGTADAFAWFYPRGAEPLELYGLLCPVCSLDLVNTVGLKKESLRPA